MPLNYGEYGGPGAFGYDAQPTVKFLDDGVTWYLAPRHYSDSHDYTCRHPVRVLEALLPRLFRGLVDRYVAGGGGGDGVVRGSGGGSGSGSSSGGGAAGETRSRVNTAHKALVGGAGALTAAQRRFLEGLEGIRLEYTLYNHTRRRLHAQAEGCGIAVPTARHDAP